jgi:hypothetical protein
MGLFRLAAVVAVGVSLLPADREKQEQLYQRAAAAATWTLTFCDRNTATCTQAASLWSDFAKKAEFGVKLAGDVIRDNENAKTAAPTAPVSFEVSPQQSGSTLTPRDLKPAWRGKTASKAGI